MFWLMKGVDYKVEAVILRAYEAKEFDRIYSIFSREKGKVKVLGIGTRKVKAKLASGMEPITLSELFLIKGRNIDRLRGVIINEQFLSLKSDLDRLILVKKVLRLLDKLSLEEEPNEAVYSSLVGWLKELNGSEMKSEKSKEELLRFSLLWKIIAWNGLQPELFHCVRCHGKIAKQEKYKLILEQGVTCGACFGQAKESGFVIVNENLMKLMRILPGCSEQVVRKLVVSREDLALLKRVTCQILSLALGERVHF